ncbi:MAG: threonine-phosphate decarboxylase [Paracoccaceae bacterium]
MSIKLDHGGGLDAAIAEYGGGRADWLDLSTGINPSPYPIPAISAAAWQDLPDQSASGRLETTARAFWNIPVGAAILAAPGASALIARIPTLAPAAAVHIHTPTYNEHAAAFSAQGWHLTDQNPTAQVIVHPNNPDGHLWSETDLTTPFTIIDESFCDITPDQTLIHCATRPGTIILKSFGKFWGLAGLRLGFAIGDPALITKLKQTLGPWPVSGPAQTIATAALNDTDWATKTRTRLITDAARLDALVTARGASVIGGTNLFRLYQTNSAKDWQHHLASHKIWSRTFPYSDTWLRLGLPHPDRWSQLQAALKSSL